MKIFWSWQSDTHGKTGRHFIRGCLKDAIDAINLEADISEPPERTRDPLTLDQDRVGVAGHRNLGDTILDKIAAADVFVGDVTLVAELEVPVTPDHPDGLKRLINSNVAIEYGYAVGKLTDDATLLVMNLYYGPLTKLPFDLAYKIPPCRYTLAPDASTDDIAKQRKALTKELVKILKLHVDRAVPAPPPPEPFQPREATRSAAFFWKPGDLLGKIGGAHPFHHDQDDTVEFRFNEPRAFYLRLMPTAAIPALDITRLTDIVGRQRLQVMAQSWGHKIPSRNTFGAIAIEPVGTSSVPLAFSQLFRSGEIWGVTRGLVSEAIGHPVVPMISLDKVLTRTLANFVEIARDELGIVPPYRVEIGAVGLRNVALSLPNPSHFTSQVSGPILDDGLVFSETLSNVSPGTQKVLIQEFIRRLYDLADVPYQPATTQQ